MQTRISHERVLDASADVVHHLIADYREHHRHQPEGFLPAAFTELVVEKGGVGAGTVIRFTGKMGGRLQTVTATVSEPEPGRVLVESSPGLVTTFTIEPAGQDRTRLRFDTVIEAGGVQGLLARLFAPGMLRPLYVEEMERIEQHARAHGALTASSPVAV
jgi:hypothetical protein